jgi:hypothetical protein
MEAICVHVEHSDGASMDVFLPYEKTRPSGLRFGDVQTTQAERVIFD